MLVQPLPTRETKSESKRSSSSSSATDSLSSTSPDVQSSAASLTPETTNKSKSAEDVDPSWVWILDTITKANLPKLGLPAAWATTQQKHTLKIWDHHHKKMIDIQTEEETEHKTLPVGFITSTKNKNPMPGTKTPAAVRFTRYEEKDFKEFRVTDAAGDTLVPCLAHGDFVKVQSLEADHLFPKSEIIKRQNELVDKLNKEKKFAKFLLKQEGMKKFFVKYEGKYYGTLFFYELYFNDIDNIWLICEACNSAKSNENTLNWLENQWAYGEEFMDHLTTLQVDQRNTVLIQKTQTQKGLAEVAIKWFWERHASYVATAKTLLKDVTVKIQILNREVDHIRGLGRERRAERRQLFLDFQLQAMSAIADMPHVPVVRTGQNTPISSDDEGGRLPLNDSQGNLMSPPTRGVFNAVATEIRAELGDMMRKTLAEKIKKKKAEAKENAEKKGKKRIDEESGSDDERVDSSENNTSSSANP